MPEQWVFERIGDALWSINGWCAWLAVVYILHELFGMEDVRITNWKKR